MINKLTTNFEAIKTYFFSGGLISLSMADITGFLQIVSLLVGIALGAQRIYIDRKKSQNDKKD